MRRLGDEQSRRSAATIEVSAADVDLPMSTQTALLRIAQGALSNAVRHADATHITVDLSAASETVMLTVRDDGCGFDTSGCASPGVPNFQGKVGPAFNDGCWQQCEGYLDVNGGDDIPVAWGNDCAGVDFSRIRLACGTGLSSYRYITVEKNVFKDGLIGYPENGLISEAKDQNGNGFAIDNVIYAENNQPNTGRSWWNGGNGCDENSTNITFNNFCTYEASNCFGQNINGDRFVWVYVAP